jgi:hypothetical protein
MDVTDEFFEAVKGMIQSGDLILIVCLYTWFYTICCFFFIYWMNVINFHGL